MVLFATPTSHHFARRKCEYADMKLIYHDLSPIIESQRQHVGVLKVLDVVRDIKQASVGFEFGVIERIVCESSRPFFDPVWCPVRVEP